jgi:acyl carrier protein
MTRQELIAVAAAALEKFDPQDVDRPIEATALDSLDLMVLRAAIETRVGAPIDDERWFSSGSLAELLARLP